MVSLVSLVGRANAANSVPVATAVATRTGARHRLQERIESTEFAALFALGVMVLICCILIACIPIRKFIADARQRAVEAMAEAQRRARSMSGAGAYGASGA